MKEKGLEFKVDLLWLDGANWFAIDEDGEGKTKPKINKDMWTWNGDYNHPSPVKFHGFSNWEKSLVKRKVGEDVL